LEARPAVRDGVALEEAGLLLDLVPVPVPKDGDARRSSGAGLVVDTPPIASVTLAGARYRSIEAALVESSSLRTAGGGDPRPRRAHRAAPAHPGARHRDHQALPALPARGGPHIL